MPSETCAIRQMAGWLFALGLVAPQLSRVAALARPAQPQRKPHPEKVVAGVALALQDCAASAQVTALCLAAHAFGGVACSASVRGGLFFFLGFLGCIDAVVLHRWGLRLEPQLLRFVPELQQIGRGRWQAPLAVALGTGGGLAAAAWAAPYSGGANAAVVGAAECAGAGAAAFALVGLAALAGRVLTPTTQQRFGNTLWLLERLAISSATSWGRHRARPRAFGTILQQLIPTGETYTGLRAELPLWRRTQRWPGPRRFAWNWEAAAKPHVIVIFLESFRGQDTTCVTPAPGLTPHFDAWATRGMLWTRHYTPGNSTGRSDIAALYGVLPGLCGRPTLNYEKPAMLVGLPHLFADRGYATAFTTSSPLSSEDIGHYFSARGFTHLFGADEVCAAYPDAPLTQWRAPFDAYTFAFHRDWLQRHDRAGQPTFSCISTMTNHDPWDLPPEPTATPVVSWTAGMRQTLDMSPAACFARNRQTLAYTDAELNKYLQALEATGILAKSIVCVLGDHGQAVDPQRGPVQLGGYLPDAVYHVPLLLLAPSYLPQPGRIDSLSSHIDILPTLMDLCDIDGPHHSMGVSVARDAPRHVVHLSHPYTPQVLGARQGPWRYNYYPQTKADSLFNVVTDPAEADDQATRQPERVAALRAQVIAVQEGAEWLHRCNHFAPSAPPYGQKALWLSLPQSLEAAAAIAQDTSAVQQLHYARCQQIITATLALALPAADRLSLVRLRLQQLYSVQLGLLSAAEVDRKIRLEERAYGMLADAPAPEAAALRTFYVQLPASLHDVDRLLRRPDDPEDARVGIYKAMVSRYLAASLTPEEKLELIRLWLQFFFSVELGSLTAEQMQRLGVMRDQVEAERMAAWLAKREAAKAGRP